MVKLPEPKTCKGCGEVFQPQWNRQQYCSEECRRGKAVCVKCGKDFLLHKNTTGKYCSPECWYADKDNDAHKRAGAKRQPLKVPKCLHCGNELEWRRGRKRLFCSRSCAIRARNIKRGVNHEVGDRMENGLGYIIVKVRKDYPGAPKGAWMLEHRYVMQEHLGRVLERRETVHHINGDKADNRIENLELWRGDHPAGIRVGDSEHLRNRS